MMPDSAGLNKSMLGPAADCVAIDQLATALEGRLGKDVKQSAEQHVKTCVWCQTELRLLREFESPSIRDDEQKDVAAIVERLRKNSPAPHVAWWKRKWTLQTLAPASLVLAAALMLIVFGLPGRRATLPPVPDGADVMRSRSVEIIAPMGDISAVPTNVRWHAAKGATRYSVRLLEVDRTPLWSTTVTQPSATIPADVQAKIVPLKTLVLQVTALNDAGSVVGASGDRSFRLTPASAQ
jgi:hypothetical protein